MLDAALGTSTARVRSVRIARDLARALPAPSVFYVTAPLGPPRLWAEISRAATTGFELALQDGTPPGESTLPRAIASAARSIEGYQSTLLEPNLPLDAQFACFLHVGDRAHLMVSSGMRVYRARDGGPQRVLGRSHATLGIAQGGLPWSTEALHRGDIYVLGSRDAFGMRSTAAIVAALSRDRVVPVWDLCEAALGPCRTEGLGAALAVLRVV